MVLLIASSALVSGASILLLKVADTILQMGAFEEHWPVVLLVLACVLYTADTQLHFLNLAIRFYDQLEVVPIYQTFLLFSWSSMGLVMFNEYRFYSTMGILGIFGAAVLCLLGVKALTAKHSQAPAGAADREAGLSPAKDAKDAEKQD